jgi:Uma2 family endonuclease
MGMAAPQTRWTVDRLQALPDDGRRYEIIDGELFMTPSPSVTHQVATFRLALRLEAYLAASRAGYLFMAPGDVQFDRATLVQPDLFVAPLVAGRRPTTWAEAGRPLLVAEVLSPGTARTDRERKRELFQARGVPEYWIVNPDARVFERWRPGDAQAEILAERIEWQPDPRHEPLVIDLGEYWREVLGE